MELYHYGIIGQKWGVRRFQNPDGTYTAEGRRRRSSEIRAENRKAFELGRTATVYGRASKLAMDKLIKTENKIDKLALTKQQGSSAKMNRLKDRREVQATTAANLTNEYKRVLQAAQEHCESLIKKYGKENIKPISYKTESNSRLGEYQLINERVVSGKEIVASILVTAGSMALPLPVFAIMAPTSKAERGRELYRDEYHRNSRRK